MANTTEERTSREDIDKLKEETLRIRALLAEVIQQSAANRAAITHVLDQVIAITRHLVGTKSALSIAEDIIDAEYDRIGEAGEL